MRPGNLPRGVIFTLKRHREKVYEVFQVSGSPGGKHKCKAFYVSKHGRSGALRLALKQRKEWLRTTAQWGGHGVKRIRIVPESVPKALRFPGLWICRHRALVCATRDFDYAGKRRTIYLCYPYQIGGGSFPCFLDALDACRKGQGVLNSLEARALPAIWRKHKAANRSRKRGENTHSYLVAIGGRIVSKTEVASFNHAYDRAA